MPRNVEIKAHVTDIEAFEKKAKELSGSDGVVLEQEDIFFHVPHGRLKLRSEKGRKSELLFYSRPDTEGPKLSDYSKCEVPEQNSLADVLTKALGRKGVVRKKRVLFMVGQTRVHVDRVEGLGNYMELEVVLEDTQSLEDGQEIAKKLMDQLGVSDNDCISGAYMDLLIK